MESFPSAPPAKESCALIHDRESIRTALQNGIQDCLSRSSCLRFVRCIRPIACGCTAEVWLGEMDEGIEVVVKLVPLWRRGSTCLSEKKLMELFSKECEIHKHVSKIGMERGIKLHHHRHQYQWSFPHVWDMWGHEKAIRLHTRSAVRIPSGGFACLHFSPTPAREGVCGICGQTEIDHAGREGGGIEIVGMVMEHVKGQSLRQYMRSQVPLNGTLPREGVNDKEWLKWEERSVTIVHLLSQSLEFLHNQCGIAHRDVRPENVILQCNRNKTCDPGDLEGTGDEEYLHLVLMDFGQSVWLQAEEVPDEVSMGVDEMSKKQMMIDVECHDICNARDMMCPEMGHGLLGDVNYHATKMDVWCVGIILLDLLGLRRTGKRVFPSGFEDGDVHSFQKEFEIKEGVKCPKISQKCFDILHETLRKESERATIERVCELCNQYRSLDTVKM